MTCKFLLLSLQLLAVSASLNFSDALKFHEKRQTPQQALSACSLVLDVLSQCGNVSPGYVTMAPSQQAPCACYNAGATTTAWRPNAFDGAVETCASYASKNDANVYRGLQPFINLCNKVGDLRTVKAAPPPAACTNVRLQRPRNHPLMCLETSVLQYAFKRRISREVIGTWLQSFSHLSNLH